METICNIKSIDIIDQVIFEQGLRIIKVETIKNESSKKPVLTLIVYLNNNIKIAKDISDYFNNKNITETPEITGGGVGIRWQIGDIDISLKGLLTNYILGGFKPFDVKKGEINITLAA